jgi:hypothetical protein
MRKAMSCETIELPSLRAPMLRLRAAFGHAPRLLWLVLAVLLSWAAEPVLLTAFEPHGVALRHELRAAGAALEAPFTLQSTPALQQGIRRHFAGHDATVDTHRLWPVVAVTLHGLSREDCLNALRDTRRIDGTVVIALQGYGSTIDCGPRNDMTWWLMP